MDLASTTRVVGVTGVARVRAERRRRMGGRVSLMETILVVDRSEARRLFGRCFE